MSVGAAESETESPIRVTSGPSSDGGRAAVSCSWEYVGRATAGSPSPSPDGSADDPDEGVAPAEPSASPGAAEPGAPEADASARFDCSAARD